MKSAKYIITWWLILIIILCCACLIISFSRNVEYVQAQQIEEKIFRKIPDNREFAEDAILVTLNKSSSLEFKQYTPKDFSIVGCKEVANLTKIVEPVVKQQLKAKRSFDINNIDEERIETALINLDVYRCHLKLTLKETGRDAVLTAIEKVMELPEVRSASPNYIYRQNTVHPNSENIDSQWALDNINIYNAWNRSTGSSDVVVGVMDSGIDSSHPEFQNRIRSDLCVDCVSSPVPSADPNPVDTTGHGTMVASIIGARGVDNGMIGICWNIQLASLRVFNSNGEALSESLALAIYVATLANIPIIVFSGGGYGGCSESELECMSLYNGLYVCSVGNEDLNTDVTYDYPGFYSTVLNNVLSVGAIKSDNTRPSVDDWGYNNGEPQGSNYGAQTVSIFAPGDNIKCAVPIAYNSTGYTFSGGTSLAAPHVAGVAALLLSFNPQLTTDEIKSAILTNVDHISSLNGLCASNGKLNAQKAIYAVSQTKEIFNNIGYEGEEFYWRGKVDATINSDSNLNGSGLFIISDDAVFNFEVKEIESYNLVLPISGTITFTLKRSNGTTALTQDTNVNVDVWNQSSISNAIFSIDTANLSVETYTLVLSSHFTRGSSYYEDNTYNYSFAVQRPVCVMDDFGYLTSWYKWKGEVILSHDALYSYSKDSSGRYVFNNSTTLNFEIGTASVFNAVREITGSVTLSLKNSSGNEVASLYCEVRVGLVSNVTLSNSTLSIGTASYANGTYTLELSCTMTRAGNLLEYEDSYPFVIDRPTSSGGSCITTGSLITLADGTQSQVENLTGNEQLLVWDMLNGTFTSAPILFIDIDPTTTYEVITLTFSDGTTVNVIDEHAFYDTTLNKYVFLRSDASQYIGHYFTKQILDGNNNMIQTTVQLVGVSIEEQITTAYSPVTYGHLCYYVNGMLSMPGNTESFINIFDVNPIIMAYDETAMAQDIATYGLYTYEEFSNIIPIPQLVFDAFNGQYLKVAIGKGITTLEEIQALLDRYSVFLE